MTTAEPKNGQRKPRLQVVLNLVFVVLVTATGLSIGIVSYWNTRSVVDSFERELFREISASVQRAAESHMADAATLVELNKSVISSGAIDLRDYESQAKHFVQVLRAYSKFTIAAIGDQHGASILAYRWQDGGLRVHEWMPRETAGSVFREYLVDDKNDSWTLHRTDPLSEFDPRTRPWYLRPQERGEAAWTEPYIFLPAETPGITFASPLYGSGGALQAVFTIDFELRFLSRFVADLKVRGSGDVFILDHQGHIIAHPDPGMTVQRSGGEVELAGAQHSSDPVVRLAWDAIRHSVESSNGGLTESTFDHNGETHVVVSRPLPISQDLQWTIVMAVPEDAVVGEIKRGNRITFAICVVAFALSLGAGLVIARRITKPLDDQVHQLERVGDFDLEEEAPVHSFIREIETMGNAITRMKTSLRSFGRYVPTDLVRSLIARNVEAEIGGERRVLSVFFSDIEGFTGLSERLSPEELVDALADYLSIMTTAIRAEQGTVDKFIGDAVMAFWGAPAPIDDHALCACRAALRCQEALAASRASWEEKGWSPLNTRIGLAMGDLVVGNMGSEQRLNYTVVGDAVNVANRLEGLNKLYGTRIMLSHTMAEAVGRRVVTRPLDRVAVKGRAQGDIVYELLGLSGEVSDDVERLAELHTAALDDYFERRWSDAIDGFERVLELRPEDQPATVLLERVRGFSDNPPPPDWSGIRRIRSK